MPCRHRSLSGRVCKGVLAVLCSVLALNAGNALTLPQGPGAYIIKGSFQAAQHTDWPGKAWAKAGPAEAGLDEARLLQARDYALTGGGSGCIVRGGRLVLVWGDQAALYDLKSSSKSIGVTALGLALLDEKVKLDDPAKQYHPTFGLPPEGNAQTGWLDRITLRHLANQTAGFEKPGGYTRLLFEPGTRWHYSDGGPNWLAECLTLVYGRDLNDVMFERVFTPLGMTTNDIRWRDNSYRPGLINGLQRREFGSGFSANVDAMARLGYLYLREGKWRDRQIVSSEFVELASRPAKEIIGLPELDNTLGNASDHYSLLWWNNGDGTMAGVPRDAFWAWGLYDSLIVVIPSLDLVVARAGKSWPRATDGHYDVLKPFLEPIAASVSGRRNDSPKGAKESRQTRISIVDGRWHINDEVTYHGTKAEGLLLNVRMVNATFEDLNRPDFDPEANTGEFIGQIPDYVAHGVRAFTLNLQGGMPGYEGAVNSAFEADGALRDSYLRRVQRVIEACDRQGAVVILGCFYQRQDQRLKDEDAVRAGVARVARWIQTNRFSNVVLEIANEYGHGGFDHRILKNPDGEAELIRLARETAPGLLVSTSGLGGGTQHETVARASDFLLIHFNSTGLADIPKRIAALKEYGKPIVCNEDEKVGEQGAEAAELCVSNGASWGLMLQELNQRFPFTFRGAADDPVVYAALKALSSTRAASGERVEIYYPPPESAGGWRALGKPQDIRLVAGVDPAKLSALKEWLLQSDERNFAAVVIRRGYIVLEVERGNSAKTDSRRVASVSKAICATVLAIASEQSQHGSAARKMKFDDRAFDFIPWARPLSDPRKATITVKQLLNHTSGICPEATGAPNDGPWEYVLGHTGDDRTAKLAFDPGTGCGYSTHALAHAALVCETVTGMPYDQFAIQALFKPLGIEHWWFQYLEGGEKYGRHPSHGLGMPARDLARIAYCMLCEGRWRDQQVIPKWFVDQTATPTHTVKTPEMRWKLNPEVFSHGWELPARHWAQTGRSGEGIPADAREKPGSGGQLIAFVPSLDLVITRQTGSSGDWGFEEYLRRACATVLDAGK